MKRTRVEFELPSKKPRVLPRPNLVECSDIQVKAFSECYVPNINWLDEDKNPLPTLKAWYGFYFDEDRPNYNRMRLGFTSTDRVLQNKARELFRSLFKMPYVLREGRLYNSDLEQIISIYGKYIIAHGVEEMKGGMYNLLLMCVSQRVLAPSRNWGIFTHGMPNMSPVPHGPYYLIYSMPSITPERGPNNPPLRVIARILVPFPENRGILSDKLEQMEKVGLIMPAMRREFLSKVVTYNEFLVQLNKISELEKVEKENEIKQIQSSLVEGSIFQPAKPVPHEFLDESSDISHLKPK